MTAFRKTPALMALLGLAGAHMAAGAPAGALGPAAPAPPLERIVSEAKKAQKSDVAAWKRYRFLRRAQREELSESGEVVEREDLEFLVTPAPPGFDEILRRLDGREPTAEEIRRHRRLAKFTKHYDVLIAGRGGDDEEGGYSLSQLLSLSSYRHAGQEAFNGVACHRLDFSPDASAPKEGLARRFVDAMTGSLWITVEGHHLAGARARTIRPISVALSLTKVHSLEVSLESRPVGNGVWLPLRIEVITRARILIKQVRKRNVYAYSDFARVGGAPTAAGHVRIPGSFG